jgi:hypothetical protein
MRLRQLLSSKAPGAARTDGPDGAAVAVPDRDGVLEEADRLVAEGHLVEAVDHLVRANRSLRDPEVLVRLVDLRHEAACAMSGGTGRAPWPPAYPDPFPDVVGSLPEIGAGGLSSEVLGGAVAHHGALVLRGMFDAGAVERSLAAIRRAEAARDAAGPDGDGGDDPWYRPFDTTVGGRMAMRRKLRGIVAEQGGTWLADSPSSTAQFLQDLESAGVVGAVAGHFGERPFFSLQKSTLRCSAPVYQHADWHQDGSFLDADVRTMNVWVALSPCGGDLPTPGLEVVPKRVPEVLPVGGAFAKHGIASELVDEAARDAPPIRPEFAAGDALMFDERFLHRTHLSEGMTEPRYALECWFFAPSHPASAYIPFLV